MDLLIRLYNFFTYTIPALLWPLAAHVLGLSPTSSKCDFKTVLVVTIMRTLFNDPNPVSMLEQQRKSITHPEVRGPIWVVEDEFPIPPQSDVKTALFQAIKALGPSTGIKDDQVEMLPVSGEWVGHREGVGKNEPDLPLAKARKFEYFMRDTKRKITVLFLHGGQFFSRSPQGRRGITHQLAKLSSGRCFALRFRLAPQNPFPAALLDCLVAYLSLLYPTPDSLHEPVPASEICLSGDSSGANICFGLLQTILELQRQSGDGKARVQWYGQERVVPLPAGLAGHSAFLDLTRSLPSETANLPFDVLPRPEISPYPDALYRPSPIWPSTPPRHHVYTPDEMLTYPLVSPITATQWGNCSTRIWLSVGQECLADANFVTARRAIEQGVVVSVEMYAAMPHDFGLIFPKSTSGRMCFANWANFICELVDHPSATKSSGLTIITPDGKARDAEFQDVVPYMTTETLKAGMKSRLRVWQHR